MPAASLRRWQLRAGPHGLCARRSQQQNVRMTIERQDCTYELVRQLDSAVLHSTQLVRLVRLCVAVSPRVGFAVFLLLDALLRRLLLQLLSAPRQDDLDVLRLLVQRASVLVGDCGAAHWLAPQHLVLLLVGVQDADDAAR